MLAVDTNIVVRLLTGDDPAQLLAVRALFESQTIWIGKTVLLETEWVLRSSLRFDEDARRNAFARLLGLPDVVVEDRKSVLNALALTLHGIGFADALHLTGIPPGTEFASFDRSFVRRAKRAGVRGISEVAARA